MDNLKTTQIMLIAGGAILLTVAVGAGWRAVAAASERDC